MPNVQGVHFEGCMLIVRNAQVAKKFYEEVLGLTTQLDLGKHVIFDAQFFLLEESDWCAFSHIEKETIQYGSRNAELVFEVNDIALFMTHLDSFSYIQRVHELKEHPWGRWAIRFYDLDGHIIEVGESMRVVVKRFLSQGMTVAETAQRSEFPESFVRMCLAELESE